MLEHLRWASTKALTPLAKLLLRLGVSPDAVTVTGTLCVMTAALWLFPTGHLVVGSLVIGLFVLTDAVDGIMARTSGRTGPWGAFLDSTLDRLADAAIFAGLAFYLLREGNDVGVVAAVASLSFGAVVPYARARAEGLGMTAAVGIAERADRLAVALVATLLVGLGLPDTVLVVALGLLAVAAAITIGQRMAVVRKQVVARAAEAPDATPVATDAADPASTSGTARARSAVEPAATIETTSPAEPGPADLEGTA